MKYERGRDRLAHEKGLARSMGQQIPTSLRESPLMVIIRGMPGSGKTTLARKLAHKHSAAKICSKDRYLWTGGGLGQGHLVINKETVTKASRMCSRMVSELL